MAGTEDAYLKRRHHTYYVVVEVPKRLRKAAGVARFTRTLKTGNLKTANRLKWPIVVEFTRRIDALERTGSDPDRELHTAAMERQIALDRESGRIGLRGCKEVLSLIDILLAQNSQMKKELEVLKGIVTAWCGVRPAPAPTRPGRATIPGRARS